MKRSHRWDTQAILAIIWDHWNDVFRNTLGQAERSLVNELREVRNKWAHQEPFSTDDAYRALDSLVRLLKAVSAPEAEEVDTQRQELLRVRFEEQARRETRRAAVAPVEGRPAGGLKPWREIVTPHPDVASGRYLQAEFAADLGQVHRGEGSDEYRDPTEFFRRTFLTEGLPHLLGNALARLNGRARSGRRAPDQLRGRQDAFDVGALPPVLRHRRERLAGIEPVLAEAGVPHPPSPARRAGRDGTLARATAP